MSDEEIQRAIDDLVEKGVVTPMTVADFKKTHLEGKFYDRLAATVFHDHDHDPGDRDLG